MFYHSFTVIQIFILDRTGFTIAFVAATFSTRKITIDDAFHAFGYLADEYNPLWREKIGSKLCRVFKGIR